MRQKIDQPESRRIYGRRLAIVEPVFANLRSNKRLDRFTYRGRTKVNIQWLLYCLVHNLEKLAHRSKRYGPKKPLCRLLRAAHRLRYFLQSLSQTLRSRISHFWSPSLLFGTSEPGDLSNLPDLFIRQSR